MGLVEEVGRYGFKRAAGGNLLVMEYLGCGGGYTDLHVIKCIELNVYMHIHTCVQGNTRTLNETGAWCCCQYSGCENLCWFWNTLPLGEIG